MFILDTNTVIYFFKGEGSVAEQLLRTPPNEIGIPTIVLFELEYGIAKSQNPEKMYQQLNELTKLITLFSFDEKCAQLAANVRVDLERKGIPIGPFDTLIAGTVLANKATLVTHNVGEFQRVPKLDMVDWY